MTRAKREAPSHDSFRIDLGLGARKGDRSTPVLDLFSERDELPWRTPTVAEAPVVEHEHHVAGFGDGDGKVPKPTSACQTEPVSHDDARRGTGRCARDEEPGAAEVPAAW